MHQLTYLLLVIINFHHTGSEIVIPDFPNGPEFEWREEGDLNIGIITSAHSTTSRGPCTGMISTSSVLIGKRTQYILNKINNDPYFLPNITLGFIFLDACGTTNGPVSRVVQLLPLSCSVPSKNSFIVGLVGPGSSSQAVPAAGMVSQFKLPLLSTFATSEELSDKSRFQYFSRLVPPDSIATEAMTQLMIEFEWSYIQLLYAEGSYGENAAKGVEKNAKKRGICIGYSYRLNADDSNDYEAIAKKLIEHKKARVIAMIAGSYYMRNILTAIEKISKGEQFIFMVVDSFGRISNYEHRQNGTLQIIYDGGIDHDFANYMYSLKPQQAKHHWEKQLWEKLGRCNYTLDATDPTSCLKHSNFSNTTLYPYSSSAVKYSDGVEVYAKAIKDLIESSCPDAFNNKSL